MADQIRPQELMQASFVGGAIVKSQIARAITEVVLGKIAHRIGFGHCPLSTQRSTGMHQGQQKLMEAMFRFIGVTRQYAGMIRLKAPVWASQIKSNITPATMAVRCKIAHPMAAISGPIFEHGFNQRLTGFVKTERQRLKRAMFRFIGVTQQYAGLICLKAPVWASQINSNITPAVMAVQRKIARLMAAIAGPIFEHGPLFSQGLTGVVETERQRLKRAMFRLIGVTRQYAGMIRLKAPVWASQINTKVTPTIMAGANNLKINFVALRRT
jgi:hypothetical protein